MENENENLLVCDDNNALNMNTNLDSNMIEANDEDTKEMEMETNMELLMDQEQENEEEIVDCLVSIGTDIKDIKSKDTVSICFFGEKLRKQGTTTETPTDLISISQTKTISVFDEMAMIAQNDDFPFWD